MVILGVVGPVGSGKSALLEELERCGAATVRADDVSRELLQPGTDLLAQVFTEFGARFRRPDGTLDRAALGELVFRDEEARERLERLTHPAMLAGLRERLADFRAAGHQVAALEAAVLDRMGARDLVDCAVLVTAPAEERIRRLVAAGLAPEEARRRVELHRALGLETPLCDYVLDNGGTVAALRAQARELLGKVEARAGGGTRSVARGRPLCYNRAGGER